MAVFHRLRSDVADLPGGGRLLADVVAQARARGVALPEATTYSSGFLDDVDVRDLVALCVALRDKGSPVPAQGLLEAFLQKSGSCTFVALPLAADAWLAELAADLRSLGFFAASPLVRPDDLPDEVTPSGEWVVRVLLADESRVVPVTLYPQSMELACGDFVRALARTNRGRFRMEVGAPTSTQEPEPRTRRALYGEDHVEVPFSVDGAPHVAHFSWETKYVLRVDTAMPTLNRAIAHTGLQWRTLGTSGVEGFTLLTDDEVERLRTELDVTAGDPSGVPC